MVNNSLKLFNQTFNLKSNDFSIPLMGVTFYNLNLTIIKKTSSDKICTGFKCPLFERSFIYGISLVIKSLHSYTIKTIFELL